MKRISAFTAFVLLGAFLVSCSQGKPGDISVNEYRIIELKPETMRYIEGTVSLNVTNNGPTLTFPEFEGELFRNETKVGDFILLEPFVIPGNNTSWTNLTAKVVVSPEISLFKIMGMARAFDPTQYYVSFDTKVRLGGLQVPLKRKKLPLSMIIKQDKE